MKFETFVRIDPKAWMCSLLSLFIYVEHTRDCSFRLSSMFNGIFAVFLDMCRLHYFSMKTMSMNFYLLPFPWNMFVGKVRRDIPDGSSPKNCINSLGGV